MNVLVVAPNLLKELQVWTRNIELFPHLEKQFRLRPRRNHSLYSPWSGILHRGVDCIFILPKCTPRCFNRERPCAHRPISHKLFDPHVLCHSLLVCHPTVLIRDPFLGGGPFLRVFSINCPRLDLMNERFLHVFHSLPKSGRDVGLGRPLEIHGDPLVVEVLPRIHIAKITD